MEIKRRAEFGVKVLALADPEGWAGEEMDRCQEASSHFAKAVETCISQLEQWSKLRAKHGAQVLPRFGELSEEALSLLEKDAPSRGEVIGTQLSGITGGLIPRPAGEILPGEESRGLMTDLCRLPNAFERIRGPGLLTWAPKEASQLGRLLANYAKYCDSGGAAKYLRLVTLGPQMPGGADITSLLDLWQHSLLKEEKANLVRHVRVTEFAVKIVPLGAGPPVISHRRLMVATISSVFQNRIPDIIYGPPPLFAVAGGKRHLD